MAKISEVVSSVAVKVNIGDWSNVDFFTSMKATEVMNPKVTQAELNGLCNAAMISNLKAHFAARGKKLTTADICKRYGLTVPPTKGDFE